MAARQNEEISALINAWRTEVHAPEILPFQSELVHRVATSLGGQQNFIEEKLSGGNEDEYFTATLYQMDIERTKYSLAKYLRCRILKIEKMVDHIVSDLTVMDRLSQHEKIFATKLNELSNAHVEDTVFARLEGDVKEQMLANSDKLLHSTPSLQEFVFCQCVERVEGIAAGPEEIRDYEVGDIFMTRYSAVQQFVLDGKLLLI